MGSNTQSLHATDIWGEYLYFQYATETGGHCWANEALDLNADFTYTPTHPNKIILLYSHVSYGSSWETILMYKNNSQRFH